MAYRQLAQQYVSELRGLTTGVRQARSALAEARQQGASVLRERKQGEWRAQRLETAARRECVLPLVPLGARLARAELAEGRRLEMRDAARPLIPHRDR